MNKEAQALVERMQNLPGDAWAILRDPADRIIAFQLERDGLAEVTYQIHHLARLEEVARRWREETTFKEG